MAECYGNGGKIDGFHGREGGMAGSYGKEVVGGDMIEPYGNEGHWIRSCEEVAAWQDHVAVEAG